MAENDVGMMEETEESYSTAVLEAPNPHRVYVLDPNFPHLTANKVCAVDGANQRFLGSFNPGYVSNMAIPPDHSELYVCETYYSRGTRGERTDIITAYDPRTLSPKAEIPLPEGRFLVVSKAVNSRTTTDGKFVLSYNMDPSQSVSVVNAQNRKYLGEIETPGAGGIFPVGRRSIYMLTANGGLMNVSFDASGNGNTSRSDTFFDAENDPLLEHEAYDRKRKKRYHVSYTGQIYPIDVSGNKAMAESPWRVVDPPEHGEAWRPGGWQPIDVHPESGRLFVNMHKGGAWTHKNAGEEVWVYDIDRRKRIDRIKLENAAVSIRVSRESDPQLYALAGTALDIYNVGSKKHLANVPSLGNSPLLVYVNRW